MLQQPLPRVKKLQANATMNFRSIEMGPVQGPMDLISMKLELLICGTCKITNITLVNVNSIRDMLHGRQKMV
eukprot:1001858-Karenia_brevis.AAC.1